MTALPTRASAQEDDLETLQLAALAAADAYEQVQLEIADLEDRFAQSELRAGELEIEIAGQKERTAAAIRSNYKLQQAQPGLIDLLLSADDFNDFISTFRYLESLSSANAREIDRLVALDHELDETLQSLENEQVQLHQREIDAAAALEEAQAAEASARARAIENAERARKAYEEEQARKAVEEKAAQQAAEQAAAEAAHKQAEEEAAAQAEAAEKQAAAEAAAAAQAAESQNTPTPEPVQEEPESTYQVSEPKVSQPAPSAPASESSYTWVLASEYGEGDGFMYGETATGDIVTPTSMGIAMRYMPLGTVVELTYNGNVCVAVVNDRGPYIAGREIDLQPAVKHALGFEGLGTVGYRVIG
ncbi:MAG: hypothetical protein IJ125_08860 [Atopobiaceae bacterium]|nr:hypothetical protein [Atopobiaceae bacterium]